MFDTHNDDTCTIHTHLPKYILTIIVFASRACIPSDMYLHKNHWTWHFEYLWWYIAWLHVAQLTAMVTKTTPDVGTFAVRGPVHKPRRKITLSSLIIFFGNLPLRISEAWGHCDSFIRSCATRPVNTETTTDVSQNVHGSRQKITLCSLMTLISNLHLHPPFRWWVHNTSLKLHVSFQSSASSFFTPCHWIT